MRPFAKMNAREGLAVSERMYRLIVLLSLLVVAPAAAQTYEPLRASWTQMNLAEQSPPWAMNADGDFITGLMHSGPARVGSFELGGPNLTSTLVRVTPGGTLRSSITLMESDISAINRQAHLLNRILAMPDGRVLTADDRGPLSISTPLLTMRDASGAPLWTMQPESDEFAMLEPFLLPDGDLFVVVHHDVPHPPARMTFPGNGGYTVQARAQSLGVIRVASDTGVVRWSRYIGGAISARPRSDGSFVVIDSPRDFAVWSADGRKQRTFRFTPESREIIDDEHHLLGDDLLVTLRFPYRVAERLAGGGERIEQLPSRLEAYDLTTGRVRWTHELPPGPRVRLGESGPDVLWVSIDHARVPVRLAGTTWDDRRFARQVRVLSFDTLGNATASADFSIPDSAMRDTQLFATPRGLFAHGVVAPLTGEIAPAYYLMQVALRPATLDIHATTSASASDATLRSQLDARVALDGLGPLVPDR